jgi:hypothetical protein
VFFANTDDSRIDCHGSSKPGKRSFGRFSRPLLEVYFQTSFRYDPKVKSLAIAETFRYCEGFRQSYSYFCLLDQKYKRGAIKSVFAQRVSFHTETNKWDSHKMSELITLQSGQDFAPTDYNEQGKGVPYMTGASCIVEGQMVVSRWTTVPRCFAYRGDTLLVCKGSGSGAVAFLSQDKVHIARQFMALRPHEGMTKEFCFYLTLHLSDKMKKSATGLIEGIDRKTVLNQRVFLPPIVEQERIVKFLSEIEKALITQEGVLKSMVSIKKGLMQQLFI